MAGPESRGGGCLSVAGRRAVLMGKRLTPAGAEIVEALTEFYEALERGPEGVAKRFTVRTIELDPTPRTNDQGSTTMATVPSARERRTSSTVGERPVERARRGERSQRLAGLLKLVGQPTRLRILLALADGPKGTGQLSKQVGQGELIVNYHLALLRASKIVDSRHEGYEAIYRLTEPGSRFLDSALGLLDEEDAVPEPRMSPSELKKLIKKVSTVITDPEEWLNTPNPQFEGRRPLDLIGTDDEVRVHIILEAAQQGFFS